MNKKISAFILTLVVILSFASSISAAFTDIPSNHPHKSDIDYCIENGFMKGYGNELFKPDGNITRGEFISVWARTFHARQHEFEDATKTKNEIDNAIVLMQGLGYVDGISKTEFSIDDIITREEVARIIQNTYLIGITANDEYKNYSDSDDISAWARDAVSVCYEKGFFAGIASEKFEPQKPITRSEVCVIITMVMNNEPTPEPIPEPTMYSITIDTLTDGVIIADKTQAKAGDTVTLTITPNAGRRLKEDSLKYNDTQQIEGDSFTMPAENVTITAEFEPYLDSIEISSPPDKVDYASGETLDLAGLEVTANYTNVTTKIVTDDITTLPANGTTFDVDNIGELEVVVSYTEDGITKTTSFTITIA